MVAWLAQSAGASAKSSKVCSCGQYAATRPWLKRRASASSKDDFLSNQLSCGKRAFSSAGSSEAMHEMRVGSSHTPVEDCMQARSL